MTKEGQKSAQRIKDDYRYEPETGKIYWKDKHDSREAFKSKMKYGYLNGEVLGKAHYAHRVAWLLHYGEWPNGNIDHINGIRTDNRVINLRVVSQQENTRNQSLSKANKSGVVGVFWDTRRCKWVASITVDAKNKFLGYFDNFDEAVAARKEAEEKYGFHENHGKRLTNH